MTLSMGICIDYHIIAIDLSTYESSFRFDKISLLPSDILSFQTNTLVYAVMCASVANESIPYFSCDANNVRGKLHKFDI